MKSKVDITPPRNRQSGMGQPALEGEEIKYWLCQARRLLSDRGKCSKIVPPIRGSSTDRKCNGRSRGEGLV